MKNYIGTVKEKIKLSSNIFKLVILSDLKEAQAGQFISILCPNRTLRRPFSIAGFKDNTFSIIIKEQGLATKYLKNLKINDEINFLAPLGKGFNIENKKSLLIGAGVGIAPIFFLKEKLDKLNIPSYFISGFKSKDEAIMGADKTYISGSVLDEVQEIIKEKNIEKIYACGPKIVLEKVSKIANENNLIAEVALEKVMACSIGVCRGCVIKIQKNSMISYASVCKDGPVFLAGEVVWD